VAPTLPLAAACAGHEIAKRIRHLANLDPQKGEFADDIVYVGADGPSEFATLDVREHLAERQEARR
jgi:hypothetical protein